MSAVRAERERTEPDVQALYSKVKKLLLTYPVKPRWTSSYETINGLQLSSETSYGVINQYDILLSKQIFAKCRTNLDDESIISDLDYNRSLKSVQNYKQNGNDDELINNKYVLQNLIYTLQHSDIVPYHEKPKHTLRVTKCVGISTSDAHKFNDREYFYDNSNRRIIQIQVCFDKHVHGLQVKWLVNEGYGHGNDIYSGSQHFSSRFSGKNIDTLVLSHNEYICCVTGSCSQWIDSLVIHTNFGRLKSFGSTNEGQPFDLEIPENCQVLGFCGSYSSQLYTLGALYGPIINNKKKSKEVMVQHINKRILKIKQISLKLQNLFADIDKKCNSDLILLKYLRSNHKQQQMNNKKCKTSNSSIRNRWIMEILKVLVKSTAKNDPSVVPQILNILAIILEDNTNDNNNGDADDDPYDDLMDFMKSIAVDNKQPNQCVRVMIAVAIARGSLFDMLSIVKMLLSQKENHNKIYNVSKILNKLHSLHSNNEKQANDTDEFHPSSSVNKYIQFNDSENALSGLQLCVILLSELQLIAIKKENNNKLNKDALSAPLHIDCSFKVLGILNEILFLAANESQTNKNNIMHRILYHSLQLLTVQVSAIDKLRITIDNFCIPSNRIKELKCILLTIMRSIPNLPNPLTKAAANALVKGQKIFFNTINTKLIYLLALLIRQQEIEQQTTDNTKLKMFLAQFTDDLVDNLSNITHIEINHTLPVMLNQFGSVGSPSQFIDSLLSSNESNGAIDEKKQDDEDKQSMKCYQLFFGTLEMLASNCWIDINNLDSSPNERMAQLLLDLQSMLLFRYQSKFEYGDKAEAMQQFSENIPISLQEVWYKMSEDINIGSLETTQQKNIDKYLFQYAKHVISISKQILEDINNINQDLNESNELSFLFENNCDVLHKSFFGKITIPLLTNLLALIESTAKDTQQQKLFKHLMRNKLFNNLLTPHISDLLKLTDVILTKSNNYCKNKLRKQYKTVHELRESPHPYPLGKTIKKLVTIPGAKELVITFDKTLCCTCSEKDFLQFFTKTCNGFVSVTSPIYGASNKWPNKITVPGDCVLIHFTTHSPNNNNDINNEAEDALQTEYGFKLSVQAQVLVNHMQKLRWLEDLSCVMVKFHTTIASSFIDPGHLGVSFDPLIPFPLLLIGGYYPYTVPVGANNNINTNNNQLHLYLHQIESWVQLKQQWDNKDYDELLWNIHNFKECKQDHAEEENDEHKTQMDDANIVAFNLAMNQLFICTPPSSILLFEQTQISKDTIAHLHCSIYAVLLRHTGIISKFADYLKILQQRPSKSMGIPRASCNSIPREIQILFERARVGVNHILEDIENEEELNCQKKDFILRSELLMKLSPAYLHMQEITGNVWDISKLIKYPKGYSSPVEKQKPWICSICFHFNDASQFYCQICESELRKNKIQGINVRFTWSKKNFPSEELFYSFQSVCCVENIIRSQRHSNHGQNYYQIAPIKKLVKQVIIFITENKTPVHIFSKLLSMQSTLGLFRIKGLQIIYENIINLKYAENIAQFAEHLSNLLTLSNVQSMSVTQSLNLTESKQIEKSVANLKLSSIHSGGFAHILSNIECCGYSISSEILSLQDNIIEFLFKQSRKCNNHQLGFTTPLLHLIGALIRTQNLEFISSIKILPYLKQFFSLKSLNSNNSTNISFQQRFAAWTAFRTLTYSTAYPMFSSLPTISIHNINKQNMSPSSKYSSSVALFTDKTQQSRIQVFNSIIKLCTNELKTLFAALQNHKINQFKHADLKEILLKLQQHRRPTGDLYANEMKDENENESGDDHTYTVTVGSHKKTKWSCGVCTYMNAVNDDTCTMCFRGVRPMFNHNDNECHSINIYVLCLNCGAQMSAKNKTCGQCKEVNENTSPLTCIYNEKLQILKWCDRLRKQSICNADVQYLYLLQQEIGWLLNTSNISTCSPSSSSSSSASSTSTSSTVQSLQSTPHKQHIISENDNELAESSQCSSIVDFTSGSIRNASNVHVLSLPFGMNQLLWLLLRCCPSKEFLTLLQQNKQIITLLLDIVMNKNRISNISPISKILAIKMLIWILPTMNPQNIKIKSQEFEYNAFFENIFEEIGESDYYSFDKLNECPLKKEENRIKNDICLELLYLIRVLFQNSNWTAIIENICFRILSIPFNKCDDVTMNSPTPHSTKSAPNSSKCASNKSSPLCSSKGSLRSSDNDDDDEKFELQNICELVETPCGSPSVPSLPICTKLSFEQKDDEKEANQSMHGHHPHATNTARTAAAHTIYFNNLINLKFHKILHKIIGILCVMGEFMSPLHEGVRVKIKHRDKEFTGTIIKIKYENCSDSTGEFTQTEILCDNGLNLAINMTNKEQFDISMLDNVSFNPLKLSRPKYLLLLLRSYIHETFISPQSSESSFCKTILRRVISVIRQFSRYNEFALMIQHFGLIQDLVAVSLQPLQKFEDNFDSSFDNENIWKSTSKTKEVERWKQNLKIGSIIDCQDRLTKWFESEIIQFDHIENKLLVHYCEWSSKWDEWLSLDSQRIAPWRTNTDGSFKNRGYNPFSNPEKDLMSLKLRNPSKNIHILQKCILGLNKFYPTITSIVNTPIKTDGDGADEHADDDEENQSQTSATVNAQISPKYNRNVHSHKTGIPCPNHAYLPILNHSNLLNDVIANETLKLENYTTANVKCAQAQNKSVVLKGKCSIYHEFKVNPPPINHIPEDYEFSGCTLFLSLILPKEKDDFGVLPSALFEWNIDKICKFNIGFADSQLSITDNFDSMHHSPIPIDCINSNNCKQLMIMISITKNRYAIYTNYDNYQFVKSISIKNHQFPQKTKMIFKMTKNKNDKLDGIGIQRMAIWRWIGLDCNAFSYLCKCKDIFIESLQNLNPATQTAIFDKTYKKIESQTNSSSDIKKVMSNPADSEPNIFMSPPRLHSNPNPNQTHHTVVDINEIHQLNQYSIILYFKLNKEKLPTPICLVQIPDGLVLSMLERDESIFETETPKTQKNAKSGTNSPKQQIRISPSETPHRFTQKRPNPDIPMLWIDKKTNIWICDQKINKKVSIGEEHVISLCVNLKKRQLSIVFHTDEIIKLNLKASTNTKFKWQKNLKANGSWSLKSKLIFGGSIHPISHHLHPKNLIIQRITIEPKCCNIHEAISLALTCFFQDDPLSDLMGHLGFNVEQIKYSKQWTSNNQQTEWLDMLIKMTQNYSSSSSKSKLNKQSAFKKYNVKIQFRKKFKKINPQTHNNNNNKSTKNYLHICAATQLDLISPEEIRWKIYKKSILMHNNTDREYKADDRNNDCNNYTNNNFDKMKANLLLCSHWLYCQMPSAMQQNELLAKRLCSFTLWNREKMSNVLTKIQFDRKNNFGWYHLVEIMYEYQMEQTALKFSGNYNAEKHGTGNTNESPSDLSFDELYVHMFAEWSEFDKKQEKLKEDACGKQICDSSNNTVYDTSNRIYQDFINDRWKFYSHSTLYKFREIGNFQRIKKNTFNKLSEIIESNLSSLYARDSVLSFLDEYICYDDNLKGLLPSINFHQAFDNISDNENLVKFLELVFEEEKFARIHALEKALKTGIEQELQSFDAKILTATKHDQQPQNFENYGCKIINALMNTVLSRFLRYFDAIYINKADTNNHKKEKQKEQKDEEDTVDVGENSKFDFNAGEHINIEFALWIVSIFVMILTETAADLYKYKHKMLILVFNETLMSLLFDYIVTGPARIGIKTALMVSQIIDIYPRKNPFQNLKKHLFETAKLCNDLCSDKYKKANIKNEVIDDGDEEETELCITVKHVGVIANVLQDMHQNSEIATDLIICLTQLMLSITCNYHHQYAIDLNSMSWFKSVCQTHSALKWFSIQQKQDRNSETLQFLSPHFYSKLYETISSWDQIREMQEKSATKQEIPTRNIGFINVLQNNIKRCSDLLHTFRTLLTLPMDVLCTQNTLIQFKKNLVTFCDISVALAVDNLPEIEDIIHVQRKIVISKTKEADPDWLILQQIKLICNKLATAFNLLYYKMFADTTNIIDKSIQCLGPSFDEIITRLVEKSIDEFQITDIISQQYTCIRTADINIDETDIDNLALNARQQSIYLLNQLILKNISYFDITNNIKSTSILCLNKHLILGNRVACHILQTALEQSQDGQANEPSFQVDRFRCKSGEEPDYLMFTECMNQLHSFKPDTFRLEPYSKAWKCQFANEHATDAGGPYRESIEWMMNEIQNNKQLNLFMLCPNGSNDHGLNRDKYVPSPNKCFYQDEKMYIFLGKLMGLAMRTKELLPLNVAPLIWKKICNHNINTNDIVSIDKSAFSIFQHLDPFIKILETYSNEIHNYDMDNAEINEDNAEINEIIAQIQIFNSLMVRTRSKFQGKSSDGNTYPLIPNGELIPITHKNVKHYKTAFINFRIHEYDFACNAIRRGLGTVIPINILNILSWNKVEELICGQSTIDIKLFKQMTTYSNCSISDRTIQLFWDVVKHKMNNMQRSKLLQFVWGRSRLPLHKSDFDKKMSILLIDHHQSNPNDYLPVSHTCFFQLDLPRYTDPDIMHQKLLYAITHCGSIDTDE